jgi:hypothetical protein
LAVFSEHRQGQARTEQRVPGTEFPAQSKIKNQKSKMFLTKFIEPWYPPTSLGLAKDSASVVHLERRRGAGFGLRRAATITLPESLILPAFDEPNIADRSELAEALRELATGAGLLRQRKWSVALPEASTRTLILTLESQVGSRVELEEILTWKMERGFGASVDELSISRDRLPSDSEGRDRYLALAVRSSVLAEYESVFDSLGWRAGLILPRHMGEARWLTKNGNAGDALLVSSFDEGFTAVVFRDKQPLILRSVACEPDEREDEFYRLLLFYRDRHLADGGAAPQSVARLLVLGSGFSKNRASEIFNETLGGRLQSLEAVDLGLQLPTGELSFDAIAAPAGLATLCWS